MNGINPIFENANPYLKLILFISMVVVSFIICMVLGFLIALPLFNINFSELLNALSQSNNPEYTSIIKYFQVVSQLGLFILPVFLFTLLVSKNTKEYLHFNQRTKVFSTVISCLIMIAAIPLINWLAEVNSKMQLPSFFSGLEHWMKESEDAAAKITEVFLNVSTISGLFTNILIVALIAAIGEELFFRGVIQKLLFQWSKNIHIAIIFTAILFGVFHLQFYGVLPRVLMGILFGYLLYWSGSIWLPILAHFTNNALAIIIDFFSRKKQINFDVDKIGTDKNGLLLVSISFVVVCALIYFFYRAEKNKNSLVKLF